MVLELFFFGGVWTQTLVLGWLVYETTRSDLLVAVFTAARLAPLLLGPFAGAFADRHNRVRLLIIACSWALVAVSVVAALTSMDRAPYWVLLVGGLAGEHLPVADLPVVHADLRAGVARPGRRGARLVAHLCRRRRACRFPRDRRPG